MFINKFKEGFDPQTSEGLVWGWPVYSFLGPSPQLLQDGCDIFSFSSHQKSLPVSMAFQSW